MGEIDISLKILVGSGGRRFLDSIGVPTTRDHLNVELPRISETRVDLLVRSGREWVHVEFQSTRSADMMHRMLAYRSALLQCMREAELPPPGSSARRIWIRSRSSAEVTHRTRSLQ